MRNFINEDTTIPSDVILISLYSKSRAYNILNAFYFSKLPNWKIEDRLIEDSPFVSFLLDIFFFFFFFFFKFANVLIIFYLLRFLLTYF